MLKDFVMEEDGGRVGRQGDSGKVRADPSSHTIASW